MACPIYLAKLSRLNSHPFVAVILLIFSWYFTSLRGRGGGGVLNNTLYGKAPSRRPTPYHFICTIFDRKGPLLFTFSHKWYPLHIPSLELCIPLTAVNLLSFKYDYYSFKIFPRFWMAKSTLIIHHNQLLMTKFGRILCLTRKWLQKCSPLQVKAPLTGKPGTRLSCFGCEKNGGHFTSFKSKNYSWN